MKNTNRFLTLTVAAAVSGIAMAGAAQADGGGEYTLQNPHSENYHTDGYYDQRDTDGEFGLQQDLGPILGLGSQDTDASHDNDRRDDRWWRDNDGYK